MRARVFTKSKLKSGTIMCHEEEVR